jgi:tetratricopeptide (TPR) repeat protein
MYTRYWGVFWIDASKDENVDSGYAAIGTQAGVGATKTSAIHWLSKRKLPWLLVLDNADDPDIDISSYFPSEGNGSVLITTRNPNAVEHATVGHLRFRGMEPVEAVRLLLKAAYSDQQNQAPPPTSPTRWQLAEGITVELGYLPLAIAHAGAAIRKNIYTLERYLKYYLPQRKSMLSHARDWSADELNIITTWETPFKKIVDRKSIEHKDAVDLMHIFAFMHHETIPVRIFERSWSGLKDDLPKSRSVPGILQSVWNESARARFRRAIGVLCDHSIIEYEPHKGLCTIHPVIHNWARNRLSDVEQMRWLRCATAILAHCISTNLETSGKEFRALSVAPMLETSGRQFRAQLVPHINSCFQMQRVQFSRKDETLQAAAEREKFAWAFAEQGQWNMARQIQEDLVRFRVKTLGKRHEDTIRAQNSLGQTLWNLFDVKAVPAMVDVQKDVIWVLWWNRPQLRDWAMWKPWQPTHTPYCLTMSELTNTLWLAGKRSIAKYTGERAVAGLTQRLGPEDPLTLRAMFHLARTYLHLEEVEKCHALLLWVLRLQKRFFGNDHPDTLMTRNELGILLCASKRHLSSAQRLVENVLRARKEIYGEEHAYTLWSVNDLAKIYTEVGRVDDAVALLEGIIPVVIRTLGEDHVGMTMTKGNLAKAYHLLERWEDASGCLLPLLEKLPRGHPDWVNATYGYARVLLKLGKLEEAENRCLGLMEQVESTKVFPRDHPRTVSIADLLVEIYRLQGRENMVAAIKSRVPKVGSVKNEDRYDPYGIRRGSHQPAKRLQSSTPVDQARRDSHQHPAQDLSPSRSRPRKQDPVAKLIVRRTF